MAEEVKARNRRESVGYKGGEVPTTSNKYEKSKSMVKAVSDSGTVHPNFYVFTNKGPGSVDGSSVMFSKCLVLPGSTASNFRLREVDPPGGAEFEAAHIDCFNANDLADPLALNDITMIAHQNVAAVLDFLRLRYVKAHIYTTADPLLVAINPFKDLGNSTPEWIKKYRDGNIDKMSPHVFAIARRALENLHSFQRNQTIIVSGESGAGKTEATKQIMKYFATSKSGASNSRIQDAIMAANPVLEAFGNAKTIRNNNSSRFGRFMQLVVAQGGGIEYGSVKNFLLEKVRVVSQEANERSYHIFYEFLKGADSAAKQKYGLLNMTEYEYLKAKSGGVYDCPNWNDVDEYKDVQKSFVAMGLSPQEIDSTWSIISGVMMMGNAKVSGKAQDGVDDAACFEGADGERINQSCKLMFLDKDLIQKELTTKITKVGGQEIQGRIRKEEAELLKVSLSKAMYDSLFSWVVKRLNESIEPPTGFVSFMGMLDIFGFEVFENNSLEQLLINITNERLQKCFVDIVFEREMLLYKNEGISAASLVWTDNKDIINCLCDKKVSVFAVLEDQCLSPGGSDQGIVAGCKKALAGNMVFREGKKNPQFSFVIAHTIASITYNSEGFILKNNDILKPDLTEIVQKSSNPVSAALFKGIEIVRGKLAKGSLIASQFLKSLESLMELIDKTEPHFVRCLKPNETKVALEWNASKVLNQLFSLSILEALQLKNLGFSYRRPFEDFLNQFRYLDMGIATSNMPKKDAAKKMLERTHLSSSEWQLGVTMVFMKPDAMKLISHKQKEIMAQWQPMVLRVEALWLRHKLRKKMKAIEPQIIRVQAHCQWYTKQGKSGGVSIGTGVINRPVKAPRAAQGKKQAITMDPWFDQFSVAYNEPPANHDEASFSNISDVTPREEVE